MARLALVAVLLGLGAGGPVSALGQRHEDAVPEGVPPGFEPVDVKEDVHQIERQQEQKMAETVDIDMDYRYTTPERALRARYGSATWNMYEPYE